MASRLDIGDAEALGIAVEYLPRDLWVLGLGHLGNAYLWSLATLPYTDPKEVEFALFDFDKVEKDNVETGIIFDAGQIGGFKTRGCDAWLDRRGFRTRLVERRFDGTFRRQYQDPPDKEPALALCGFDSNLPRRDLATADFAVSSSAGLAVWRTTSTRSAFTRCPIREPRRFVAGLERGRGAKLAAHQERMARENPGYQVSAPTTAAGAISPASRSRCRSWVRRGGFGGGGSYPTFSRRPGLSRYQAFAG